MPPYAIAFANRQRILSVDRRRLARLARSLLAREQVARADISVAIVNDRQIHLLNREFLSHDYPTDVISFLLDGEVAPHGRAKTPRRLEAAGVPVAGRGRRSRARALVARRGAGKTIDGEIVISAETARRAARDLGTNSAAELALYLVHGLLHLCGYDDRSPPERRLMRRREAEALHNWATPTPRPRLRSRTN